MLERHIEIDAKHQAVSAMVQPSRAIILERNKELRKNPGAIKHLSFMGLEYNMPLVDYLQAMKFIKRNHPGITHTDTMEVLTGFLEQHGHDYRVRG